MRNTLGVEGVSRVRRVGLVLVMLGLAVLAALVGCTEQPDASLPPSAVDSGGTLPSVAADPIEDFLPARRAAVTQLPAGVSAGDLRVVSDRPEFPEAWWRTHDAPPFKMVHLRLEAGGASPGRFDCWSSQADESSAWVCEIVESGN